MRNKKVPYFLLHHCIIETQYIHIVILVRYRKKYFSYYLYQFLFTCDRYRQLLEHVLFNV